jgi:bilirubin oxidase
MFTTALAVALAATGCAAQQRGNYGPQHGSWGQPQGGPNGGYSVPGQSGWRGQGQSAGSPEYKYMFEVPLPQGSVAMPIYTTEVNGVPIDYYEVTIEPFAQKIYPDLGPAYLVGYNSTAPGPTFWIEKGRETVIRYLNHGNVSAAVHLHGSYTHSAWDGWASDDMAIGQFKDYYYPNSESARTIWYHDHANGHTASDAYYGQAGVYIIYDPSEDNLNLPNYKYDIPLAISDKTYTSSGDLADPTGNLMNFFGDLIHVNDQPWPYLAVEPRKYRLRMIDISLSRAYDLYFVDSEGNWIDFQVIASDSGLFGAPVPTNDLTIAPGERYEVVIDFGKYAGQNITLGNKMQQQQIQEYENTDKVMRFVVGNDVSNHDNNGDVPSVLNPDIQWPAKRTTVDHVFVSFRPH